MELLFTKFLRSWSGGPFPEVHLRVLEEPEGLYSFLRVYFRKWFVHPLRRRIARVWLAFLRRFFGLRVVALTGSAGKTTTKEMILSVLSQKYRTLATQENIDPVFNIPATALKARPWTEVLVLEMGIEFPGEMDFYLWLAKPDAAVLTSVYLTHTEFLGDIKGVEREKTKLIKAVGKKGYVVLNADDKRVAKYADKVAGKAILYGLGKKAEVSAEDIEVTAALSTRFTLKIKKRSISVELPALGEQNVSNALCAAAIGQIYNVSLGAIKAGLESFVPAPHRMRPLKTKSGAWIIDDAYNSNPLATKKALDALAKIPARQRIAVLGEMKELGDFERRAHEEVGEYAGKLGIDEVIGFGRPTRYLLEKAENKADVYLAKSKRDIVRRLEGRLGEGTVVLVKGSRSLRMEELIPSLVS